MQKKQYSAYGKVTTGDDVFSFGIERYHDLLRAAEQDRAQASPLTPTRTNNQRSILAMLWQYLSHLF